MKKEIQSPQKPRMSDKVKILRPLSERKFAIHFPEASRTKQSFKDEADINKRMARYRKTGFLTDPLKVSNRQAFFADVCAAGDYMEQQNRVIEINKEFARLPSEIRNYFKNSPKELLSFLDDPENRQEAIDMGLLEGQKTKPTPKAEKPSIEDPPLNSDDTNRSGSKTGGDTPPGVSPIGDPPK